MKKLIKELLKVNRDLEINQFCSLRHYFEDALGNKGDYLTI